MRLAIILPFYLALSVLILAAGPGARGAAAAGRIFARLNSPHNR